MHYFFDSSALAKLFHPEQGSDTVIEIFAERRNRAFTSRLAVVELTSVAGIKVRTGEITAETASAFLADVAESADSQRFIIQRILDEDYRQAQALLTQYAQGHSLRTLDSLQLASAMRLRERTHIDFFVTSDRTLAKVAAFEGFAVSIPEEA